MPYLTHCDRCGNLLGEGAIRRRVNAYCSDKCAGVRLTRTEVARGRAVVAEAAAVLPVPARSGNVRGVRGG